MPVTVPDLRRGFATARLLRLRVRIPPRAWMSVLRYTSTLSGRRLCDGLITRPESSTDSGVSGCEAGTSIMEPWHTRAVER